MKFSSAVLHSGRGGTVVERQARPDAEAGFVFLHQNQLPPAGPGLPPACSVMAIGKRRSRREVINFAAARGSG
jgi:hypothetical protein